MKIKSLITHPIWYLDVRTILRVLDDWNEGKLQSIDEVEVLHAEIDRDHLRAEFSHPYAVKLMAMSFADSLDKCPGAKNYLEIHMESEKHGPLCVTLQRRWGKTPGQIKDEAERVVAVLRLENEHLLSRLSEYETKKST